VYFAGCSSTADNTSTPSETTAESQNSQEQYLEIRNRTENEVSVSLKVEGPDSVILQEDAEVGAGKTVKIPLQITEEGKYELSVSRSGGNEVSQTLVIGDYDLEHGPNVIIEVRGEQIEITELE
jgi:P pilus assembly chaperone PapD